MRPSGDAAYLEQRRRRAVALALSGTPAAQVARETGATVRSVYRWTAAYREEGDDGLGARPAQGRPRRLSPEQEAELMRLLRRGPEANGLRYKNWDLLPIAKLVLREFDIRYSCDHVRIVLRRIAGLTVRELNHMGWTED
jgi:transposase